MVGRGDGALLRDVFDARGSPRRQFPLPLHVRLGLCRLPVAAKIRVSRVGFRTCRDGHHKRGETQHSTARVLVVGGQEQGGI